jgi:hypothetical protein
VVAPGLYRKLQYKLPATLNFGMINEALMTLIGKPQPKPTPTAT